MGATIGCLALEKQTARSVPSRGPRDQPDAGVFTVQQWCSPQILAVGGSGRQALKEILGRDAVDCDLDRTVGASRGLRDRHGIAAHGSE